MEGLLKKSWFIAKELSVDPESVLEWKMSKFILWSMVSEDYTNEYLLLTSWLTNYAVWDAGNLPKILKISSPEKAKTGEEIISSIKKKAKGLKFKKASLEEAVKKAKD